MNMSLGSITVDQQQNATEQPRSPQFLNCAVWSVQNRFYKSSCFWGSVLVARIAALTLILLFGAPVSAAWNKGFGHPGTAAVIVSRARDQRKKRLRRY